MKDIMGIMKKAGEMQAKMQKVQEEISGAELEGSAGGGLVCVTLSGTGEMRSLKIDPSLMNSSDEVEILEDLILAAHNDAKEKVEAHRNEQMKAMSADITLPGGLKLPF